AGRIGRDLAGGPQRRIGVTDAQLLQEDGPGVEETGSECGQKDLFRIRAAARASEQRRARVGNRRALGQSSLSRSLGVAGPGRVDVETMTLSHGEAAMMT